jgi:hypothetical protein
VVCDSSQSAILNVTYSLHDEEHYESRSLRSDPRLAKDFICRGCCETNPQQMWQCGSVVTRRRPAAHVHSRTCDAPMRFACRHRQGKCQGTPPIELERGVSYKKKNHSACDAGVFRHEELGDRELQAGITLAFLVVVHKASVDVYPSTSSRFPHHGSRRIILIAHRTLASPISEWRAYGSKWK